MSNRRYDNEEKIASQYFYSSSPDEQPILKNRLNIKNQVELEIVENSIVSVMFSTRPKLSLFTLKEIQHIHKHLFYPLYDWGGKLRNYTTGRGKMPFARPEMIQNYYNTQILLKLKAEKYLIGANQDQFIKRSAHFINEFNAIHPFIDGNGRITRIFLSDLAEKSCNHITLDYIEKDNWYRAMEVGFSTGNTKLIEKEIANCINIATHLAFKNQ